MGTSASSYDLDNDQVIAVVSNPSLANYGQLILVKKAELDNVSAVQAASWSVSFTQPTDGTAPKFTYVNKATGLTLSLDPNDAGKLATIKGASSEWLNSSVTNNGSNFIEFETLRSFYDANKAVFMYAGTEINKTDDGAGVDFFGTEKTDKDKIAYTPLYVGISANTSDLWYDANENKTEDSNEAAVSVAPVQPNVVNLDANDLNSQLGKLDLSVVPDDEEYFNLYFNQDVTSGAETNLFAATPLHAEQVTYTEEEANAPGSSVTKGDPTPYVRLKAKDMDGAYITVDTAYHAGSETIGKLPKFTYAKKDYEGTNNVPRLAASSQFAFAYDAFNDRLLIKVRGYYTRTRETYETPNPIKDGGADGNAAYTRWGYKTDGTVDDTDGLISDAYVRLATLASVRELTVAAENISTDNYTTPTWTMTGEPWSNFGMLTSISMTTAQSFAPTTIADGLYLIKLHTSGYDEDGEKRNAADGDYLIASLKGNFGYAAQARNQNYDHMPAAQWLVQKQGTGNAPIKIINREFFDVEWDGYFGEDGAAIQAYNAGAANRIIFRTGSFANDTLEFIPVSDASKKDAYLGYKYVDEKQASVETYYFNYLSGLALDKGLNTPIDNDSLVRVDENGDKIALRLIPVVKDDSYGQQADESKTGVAKLIRNAYYIEAYDNLKFAADGQSRYLSYDAATDKYVMTTVPTAFFLKENNDINGTHYYALVDADLYGALYGEVKPYWIEPNNNAKVVYYEWAKNKDNTSLKDLMYPAKYKGMSIIKDEFDVWSYKELYNGKYTEHSSDPIKSPLTEQQKSDLFIPFYDADGEPIIEDASKAIQLYAYMANSNGVIELTPITTKKDSEGTKYYAMNPDEDLNQIGVFVKPATKPGKVNGVTSTITDEEFTNLPETWGVTSGSVDYASSRISVDDNTLDLFKAELNNQTWSNELRVSAFEAAINNSPLYRRFNGAAPETYGTAANAPLNLKFYRYNNNSEYLFENLSSENEYRDGINDKNISFLGVNNVYQFPENETRSYTMFVDTAYVRSNTRMPQYLIGIRPEVVEGDTIWCNATSAHHHETLADSLACDHTVFTTGFTRAMYLFNAQDSIDAKNYDYQGKVAQGAQNYTRLAFKDAVHAGDTLYILKPNVTTKQLIDSDLKNQDLFANKIFLGNNLHKNVVFSLRLVGDDDNRFLIESEAEQGGSAVLNSQLTQESIAPMRGGWVKIQNGVPVIARLQDFNEAIAQAEIFDVNDEIQYDATANDEVAVESVKVIASDGQVTIMGAAGKNVTITTVLGKTVVAKTIASDNETIAVPTTGIVAVAVEGEEAVMTIVK